MQRRTFLKTSAMATGFAALSHSLAQPLFAMNQDSKFFDNIGLQLWTVRDQIAEDTAATLKAVKDAGYAQVELSAVMGSDEIIKVCDEIDLNYTSSFINWNSVLHPSQKDASRLEDIVAKAKELGLKHLVFGYIGKGSRETVDQMKKAAEASNKLGEMCNEADIKLCYHNHAFEFEKLEGGELTGFDVLMNEFDNDLCKFELDVFWAELGGWDPIETLKKLDGRVTQVHLKDLKKDTPTIYDEGKVPHEAFEEVGDGSIDMVKVMKVAAEIGAEQCHVEQDQSPDPIASIGQSYEYLKKVCS
jgi:sugar phosphate isomerase/epimerase